MKNLLIAAELAIKQIKFLDSLRNDPKPLISTEVVIDDLEKAICEIEGEYREVNKCS